MRKTEPRASLATLKPARSPAPRVAKSRQARIVELEAELAQAEGRGLTKLAKLAKGAIAIEKGALRKRERLATEYRDPAWTDPRHAETRRRATLAKLLNSESPPPDPSMNKTIAKASLGALRPRAQAVDDADDKSYRGDATPLDLIKAARRRPEQLHKVDPARRVAEKPKK